MTSTATTRTATADLITSRLVAVIAPGIPGAGRLAHPLGHQTAQRRRSRALNRGLGSTPRLRPEVAR
jgi:hypothetical protein